MLSVLCVFLAGIGGYWCWSRQGFADPMVWRIVGALSIMLLAVAAVALPPWLELSKMLGLLLMPLGLVWLGLALATVLLHSRLRWLCLGCWIVLSLGGNPWLGALLMQTLERPFLDDERLPSGHFDAVVVLGGGSNGMGFGRPQLGDSGDRILLAAQLHHAGAAPILIATGSDPLGNDDEGSGSEHTATIWQSLGIRSSALRLIPGPRTTSEEIQALAAIMADESWHRVGLITSAWHMPRAMYLAERHQLELVPLPCDSRSRMPDLSPVHLIPQQQGVSLVQRAIWEYLGRWAGR
ncbi:MAG: YdcF family protein [Planctomycetota bacterium]|nr:MAG: YdcF family protein [Planctomycetota bacterium]